MESISSLPVPHDMDADYSPQYVKLARILRDKITSGSLKRADSLPASRLVGEYKVSVQVAYAALEMLEANRYVTRPGPFRRYRITEETGPPSPSPLPLR